MKNRLGQTLEKQMNGSSHTFKVCVMLDILYTITNYKVF